MKAKIILSKVELTKLITEVLFKQPNIKEVGKILFYSDSGVFDRVVVDVEFTPSNT